MSRNKATKESPPFRLLGTMILLVLGLVVAYATLAIGILSLVQQLVHLEDKSYTLLWPILLLTVSVILGVLLAVFMAVNMLTSALALARYDARTSGDAPNGQLEVFLDEHFDNARMEHIYPNAKKVTKAE